MKTLSTFQLVLALGLATLGGHATGDEVHQAARDGQLAKLKELVSANPQLVHDKQLDGGTPLHEGVEHPEIVAYLLERGASPNALSADNYTPLHGAAFHGAERSAQQLLERGANVDAAATNKLTPLLIAAMRGHTQTVVMLIKHRADLALKDKQGNTALHAAAKAGNLGVVEVLVKAGADVQSKNLLGFKPIDLVSGTENDSLADFLQAHMKASSASEMPSIVGELGDTDRLVFRGVKTFREAAIRQALIMNPDFLLAAHFAAPFGDYLTMVGQLIQRGYEETGFPEPKVSVQFDRTNRTVVVAVAEGPRYRRGEIRVSGARTLSVPQFVRRLTEPWPPSDQASSFLASDQSKTTAPSDGKVHLTAEARLKADGTQDKLVLDKFGRKVKKQEPAWPRGEPAPFSRLAQSQIQSAVTNLLPQLGLFFARVDVRVVPEKTNGTAVLEITIIDEGPRGEVSEIIVTGNQRDTREEILKYLDLKPGVAVSSELIDRLEQTLWNSARYLHSSVSPSLVDPQDNRLTLHMDLKEYPAAAPLLQPLSPGERITLKARDWLSLFPDRQEDLVFSLTNFSSGLSSAQLILSPRGTMLLLKDRGSNHVERVLQSLVVMPGMVGFFSPEHDRKLILPELGYQLNGYLSVLPEDDPDKPPFTVSLGAGFAPTPSPTNSDAPFRIDLTLAPAAFIDLVVGGNYTNRLEAGVFSIYDSNTFIRLDAETGRLLGWIEAGEPGGSIRVTSNAFVVASHEIIGAMGQVTNAYRPERPFSSPVAYLFRELADSPWAAALWTNKANATVEKWQAAAGVVSKLLDQDILAPLDELMQKHSASPGDPFYIPMDPTVGGQNPMQGVLTLSAAFIHRVSDDLFPPRSWPWTVPREAVFVLAGRDKYTGLELEWLYESPETGPLGFLAIAQLLSYTSSPHVRSFAARGLNRLETVEFHKDCQLVLAGQPAVVATVQRIVTACAGLSDADIKALAGISTPEAAQGMRLGVGLLRANKDKPLKEVVQPLLDLYWEGALKRQVESALKKLLNPEPEKKA